MLAVRGEERTPVLPRITRFNCWRMAGSQKLKRYDMYRLVRNHAHPCMVRAVWGAQERLGLRQRMHTEITPYLLLSAAGSLGATKGRGHIVEDFDSFTTLELLERFSSLQGEFGIPWKHGPPLPNASDHSRDSLPAPPNRSRNVRAREERSGFRRASVAPGQRHDPRSSLSTHVVILMALCHAGPGE